MTCRLPIDLDRLRRLSHSPRLADESFRRGEDACSCDAHIDACGEWLVWVISGYASVDGNSQGPTKSRPLESSTSPRRRPVEKLAPEFWSDGHQHKQVDIA